MRDSTDNVGRLMHATLVNELAAVGAPRPPDYDVQSWTRAVQNMLQVPFIDAASVVFEIVNGRPYEEVQCVQLAYIAAVHAGFERIIADWRQYRKDCFPQ